MEDLVPVDSLVPLVRLVPQEALELPEVLDDKVKYNLASSLNVDIKCTRKHPYF